MYCMTVQEKFEGLAKDRFFGIPVKDFEVGGREQLRYLQWAGLRCDSKLVDIGCGVLRAGYWIIGLLDPNCYCGIEPHPERLQIGIQRILDPGTMERKRPRFDNNAQFDTSVFSEKFDFFLAYSIWTHASKPQIQTMLDGFLRDSTDQGKFLTTYLPANWMRRDYRGDKWYGTSHESEVPGCIGHDFKWIGAECEARGLRVSKLARDVTHGQSWLLLEKKG
jgi:hypothetical protein